MHPFDIIMIVVMIWAAIVGFRDGLLKQVLSWAGFIIGIVVAVKHAGTLSDKAGISTWIGFLILCIGIPLLFSWGASLFSKLLDWTVVLGILNRLTGMVLSICKYVLLASLIVYYGAKLVDVPQSVKDDSLSYCIFNSIGAGISRAF